MATLRRSTEKNFGIKPHGDIRNVDIASIPSHDILCAGFPCQPFSKAGDQKGLDMPSMGQSHRLRDRDIASKGATLFHYGLRMFQTSIRHNGGETWSLI